MENSEGISSSEEDPEVIQAASTLVSMKHAKPKKKLQDEDEYCYTPDISSTKKRKDFSAGQCSRLSAENMGQLESAMEVDNENTADNDIMIPQVKKLQGLIGKCSEPFEKHLSKSDVADENNQLLLIQTEVERFILPLLNKEENPSEGVQVTVYDWNGKEYPMMFKIHTKGECVLTSGWKKFHKDHRLRAHGDSITLWMLRHVGTGKPCFVIRNQRSATLERLDKSRGRKN